MGEVDDRRAVHVLHVGAQRRVLQDVRHQADLDQLVADAVEQVEDLPVRLERQGDHDLIDVVLLDCCFQVVECADDADAADALGGDRVRVVVQEAHDLVAEFPVPDQFGRDLLAAVAGADDQDAAHVVPPTPDHAQDGAGDEADQRDQEDVAGREQSEEGAAVGEGVVAAGLRHAVEGQDRGQDHERQDGRDDDADRFVHPAVPAADAVEAVEVVDRGPDQQDEGQHPEVRLEVRRRLRHFDHRLHEAQVPGQEEGADRGGDIAGDVQRGGDAESVLEHGAGIVGV